MDKKSRNKLQSIREEYQRICSNLETIHDKLEDFETMLDYLNEEEQFKLENVPENLRNSEAYSDREYAASALADVVASATTITADCNNLVDAINELIEDIDNVES